MPKRSARLISALRVEAQAHQQLVNIGAELHTVYKAGQEPDADEMQRLRQAFENLIVAATAVHTVASKDLSVLRRRRPA